MPIDRPPASATSAAVSVLDASRFTPENRRRLGAPALRTFLSIADLWRLDEGRRLLMLGLPARSTYYAWVKAVREHGEVLLPVDTLLRISAVLGIHKALQILHETEAEGVAWLVGPHAAPPFFGRAPLAVMAGGTQDALMSVRRFLDAARGGAYMAPNEVDRDARPMTDADIVIA
jgi:hypothetical protein